LLFLRLLLLLAQFGRNLLQLLGLALLLLLQFLHARLDLLHLLGTAVLLLGGGLHTLLVEVVHELEGLLEFLDFGLLQEGGVHELLLLLLVLPEVVEQVATVGDDVELLVLDLLAF